MNYRLTLAAIATLCSVACRPSERAAEVKDSTAGAIAADTLAPSAHNASAQLATSTRHGEWVDINADSARDLRAWIVYPERPDTAPVVVVVHEIFGLTTWVRAVADRLAAEGYIAIAPDLMSSQRLPMPPDSLASNPGGLDSAIAAVSRLDPAETVRRIRATAAYAMRQPAAAKRWAVVGFCWGGTQVFMTAAAAPDLAAAVAYYGGITKEQANLLNVNAPTLGLYGENDARVTETQEYVKFSYAEAKVPFEAMVYAGAGHGFLRQQDARDGANSVAARAAWPKMLEWLKRYLDNGKK